MKISVVIPTRNEAVCIEGTLIRLRETAPAESIEVIVVDAASTDGTTDMARRLADIFLPATAAGRGAQLHQGAQAATGDLILFLHADSRLPGDWHAVLLAAWSANPSAAATAFRTEFDDPRLLYRFISWGANLRHRLSGVPHGDQGIAVRREVYARSGGFPPVALMEEYELATRLRPLGVLGTLPAAIRSSTRRYERNGPLFHALRNIGMIFLYRVGVSAPVLARLYATRLPPWMAPSVAGAGMTAAFVAIALLGDLRERLPAFFGAFAAAAVLFAWMIRRLHLGRMMPLGALLIFAILFRLSLTGVTPTLSDDIYRYVWDGRVQNAGINPFRYPPDSPELMRLRDESYPFINHKGIATIYPPVTQLLFRVAALGPAVLSQKILILFFDLLTIFALIVLLRIRGRDPSWVAVYAWNPLVILEFAGSGHMDVIAIGFFVLALVFLHRERPLLSGAALGFTFLAKFAGVLLVPFLVVRRQWASLAVFGAMALGGYALFAVGSGFLSGTPSLFSGARTYVRDWSFNGSLYPVVRTVVGSPAVAKIAIAGFVAGLGFWGAGRRWDSAKLSYYLFGAGILLTPTLYPWYVLWIVPLLCVFPHPGWLAFSMTVSLSYLVWPIYRATGEWTLNSAILFFEYAPLYAAFAWRSRGRLNLQPRHSTRELMNT